MRSPGRTSVPGSFPPALWSLLILAAAVIGGLAAATLRHVSLLIAVLVPLAIGGITIYALTRWPAPPPPPVPPTPEPDRPSYPVPPAETGVMVRLQPVQPRQATNPQWWEKTDGPPPAPSQDARLVPAPDLFSYLASTLIAQCPNCAAFGLEATRMRGGGSWSFRCESCEYTWAWQPGTPWPPVRVQPGRRKQPCPPAP